VAQKYVISGTDKGASVDGTERVVLEADAGTPTKVIGVNEPCELSKKDKETLKGLGINFAKADESSDTSQAPQAGTDTAAAGPIITKK
jgi:hypothetical protein